MAGSVKDTFFQSKELEELLNIIDKLRAQGISRYIDLPQIIVCGDQSSGKSSVLEAVSGVQFPTKDNLCTRFPTELVLRRGQQVNFTVTIVPDTRRPQDEQAKLQAFKVENKVLKDFENIVEAAGQAMSLDKDSRVFSYDVLRVEVTGPTQPHLTLVDLPGLFHAGNKAQSVSDADSVKNLVTGYMKKSRSIILAVVSAKNDYANQIVTKYAQDVDPHGERTLGIITKPDTLHAGSESEKQFFELAQNKDVTLRLGWHVLKNRDFNNKDCSIEERDEQEAAFFGKGIWTSMSPNQMGIGSLKPRLSRVLRDQILTELPGLIKDVKNGIQECEGRLSRLGGPRATKQQQRLYLHKVSEQFRQLVQDAVSATYNHRFFKDDKMDVDSDGDIDDEDDDNDEDDDTESESDKRMRTAVTNLLDDFSREVALKGRQYVIVDRGFALPTGTTPIPITRADRLKQISNMIKRNRGLELPGFQKFDNITMLFKEQCGPWETIVKKYAGLILDVVRNALFLILKATADEMTFDGIARFILNPALNEIKNDFNERVQLNLEQHQNGHPITYNHYFTTNLQKARAEVEGEILAERLEIYFNHTAGIDQPFERSNIRIDALCDALTKRTEEDMNKFTCTEALYFMEAYYKVAMKFFIDDFAMHTVEQGLLSKLEDIFTPEKTLALDDDTIASIAGETEESMVERASSETKRDMLQKALQVLHRLDRGQLRRVKVEPAQA